MEVMVEEDKTKIALIPAYEPDANLKNLVDELLLNDFAVVVVNDGSGREYDKYYPSNCNIIKYENNKGKGYALKEGLKYIDNNYKDYIVVTMDSDGQHKVSDAIKLCSYVENNPDTLVLGKRKRGKNTPLRSYFGNTITRIVYSLVTKVDIYDTQTGLRAFTKELVPYMLEVDGNRFEYEMNVLLYSSVNNIKLKEIDIEVIYIDNNSKSHFDTLKDSFKVYKEILKFSLSSFSSFIIDYLLYTILFIITSNIIFSNIIARIFSSLFNYNMNKRLVFKSTNKDNYSFIKYYLLAGFILLCNTIVLKFISIYINVYIAKVITELILFILSYFIQKLFIFKGSDNNKKISN